VASRNSADVVSEKTPVKHDRKNKSNFIGPLIGVNENRGLTPARLQAAGPYPHPVLKVMGYPTRYYRGALTPATASTHLYVTGDVYEYELGRLERLEATAGSSVESSEEALWPEAL
jgi:hypothetical protein